MTLSRVYDTHERKNFYHGAEFEAAQSEPHQRRE